jgi:anti-sigma B factor antagonist
LDKVSYFLRRTTRLRGPHSQHTPLRERSGPGDGGLTIQSGGIDMSLAEEFEVREHTEFEIRTGGGRDRHVIQPHGELDPATADQLHAALTAALEGGTQTIVLDLSRLNFIDSSGIHFIVQAIEITRERGRDFFLLRGPQQIQATFDLAGITDRLPFAA